MLKKYNFKTKLYLLFIYLLAIASIIYVFKNYNFNPSYNSIEVIIVFSVLAVVAESLQVEINHISVSTGFIITIAVVLLFGPKVSIIVVSAGALLRVSKSNNKIVHILNTPIYMTLFNISNFIISTLLSSKVYEILGGQYYNIKGITFLPVAAFACSFLLTNFLIIYYLVHTYTSKNFFALLSENISMGLLNIIAMVPLGIMIAVAYLQNQYLGIIITFGPILLARYSIMLYINMKKSYVDTVNALSLAIEAKDQYTEGHSSRVVYYAEKIGREMRFSENHIDNLKIASILHDIGKIGIPEAILNKPGRLTDEEYAVIKSHPSIGANIIKDIDALKGISDVIKHHHERYDGKGYPDGMGGDRIQLDAYIISLADAYDAMCSDRPYRKAMTREQAVDIIKQERGKQFNPKVVDVFLKILESEGDKICS
jgi:uncharacterized domain HDIG